MKAEIISIGTEILLGDIVNTNAQFLSKELAVLGIDVYFQAVVGDNAERLLQVISAAYENSDMIITTGGLGPTFDDLTKETAAKYFGLDMEFNEWAYKRIEKYFRRIGRELTENNKKQAYVPKGSIVMQNSRGTAPGVIIEKDGKIFVMLPGPPHEMETMFKEQVRPFLEEKQEYTFVSRIMRIADVGESNMETRVRDMVENMENPTVAPYAKPTESFLRITAKAKDAEEANRLIDPVAQEIRNRFGDAVYAEGETTMEEVVGKLLMEKNLKTSVAESLTGGLVSAALINNAGISSVFMEGIVAYSNEAKIRLLGVNPETIEKFGAVSEACAMEMAKGAAERSGCRIGLSTTGIAGPDGGTDEKPVGTVYVGVYADGKNYAEKLSFSGTRERIRNRSVYSALNILRKEILDIG